MHSRLLLFLALPLVCQAATPSVNLGALPLAFEPDPSGAYNARGAGLGVSVRPAGASIRAGKATIQMRFTGANPDARPQPLDRLPGSVSYFIGSDPSKWRAGLPTFGRIEYHAVYPGIDVAYYGNGAQLEYDFQLAPGADSRAIRLQFDGATRPAILAGGVLAVGGLRQHRPVAYQTIAGKRVEVECGYVLRARGEVGLRLGSYDRSQPLIIDPVLSYASYLGGSVNEAVTSVKVDSAGNIYMAGFTSSIAFPTRGAAQANYAGNNSPLLQVQFGDAFVAKLNPSGTALLYATYLGGSGDDFASSIAIDAAGNAYVAGNTQSSNFPTTLGAPQRTYKGFSDDNGFYDPGDGWVAKLNAAGNQILYSTYLGGTLNDFAAGIAVDSNGNAVVVGATTSSDFPTTTGALYTQYRGANNAQPNFGPSIAGDGFITILNSAGTAYLHSTYFGGSGRDGISAVALDAQNNIYVTGITLSSNFPVTPGAAQGTFKGVAQNVDGANLVPGDAFVSKLTSGGALVYSTYVGGARQDAGMSIAVDAAGSAYVAGGTLSTDFPVTSGAAQSGFKGTGAVGQVGEAYGGDAFVTKVNSAGTAFVYSTYLGGAGDEAALAMAVDGAGDALVTGFTLSKDFPTSADALQKTNAGFGGQGLAPYPAFGFDSERVRNTGDAFLTKLSPAGAISYSSFYGGSRDDLALAIAVDAAGNPYVAGNTLSPSLAGVSAGSAQASFGGAGAQFPRGDGFVAKFDFGGVLAPTPARINVVSGFSGTGTVSTMLATPFTVEVLDAAGAPVPGITVTFSAVNATATPASATTNAQGRASTTVTLGATAGTGSVSASVAGLTAATGTLTITPAAASGPVVKAVVNGASYLKTVAPGSWISVYVDVTASALSQASGTLPTILGGFRVLAGTRAMPLLAIIPLSPSGTQINAQLPYEVAPGNVGITVEQNGVASAAFPATVQASAPGIFLFGDNRAVAQNLAPNGSVSVNTADNPIPAGDYIILYLTGQGPLDNAVATGAAASGSPLSVPTLPYSATLGDTAIPIAFLGMTPGNIALAQANIQIPRNTPPGTYTLSVKIGEAVSNAPVITVTNPRP
jgi:uncharacterized protein (TIGR03437 family)